MDEVFKRNKTRKTKTEITAMSRKELGEYVQKISDEISSNFSFSMRDLYIVLGSMIIASGFQHVLTKPEDVDTYIWYKIFLFAAVGTSLFMYFLTKYMLRRVTRKNEELKKYLEIITQMLSQRE